MRTESRALDRMLVLACRTRDWGETAGQLFRLLLVPLGHLTGCLPLGNPGRAQVSAFAPRPVPPALHTLLVPAHRHVPAVPDPGLGLPD